jgi:hypothetical protein
MQTNFFTLPSRHVIFISLFLCLPQLLIPNDLREIAKKNVMIAQEKITKRFETKLAQKNKELELCVIAVKTEPRYSALEKAIQELHKEPAHTLYTLTYETHSFIEELESYNKVIIRPELLTKINILLDQLKTSEILSSLRSTLKKQRVALLELFEEKDLILSVEKILQYQNKELVELLIEQQKKVIVLPSYQQVQELQKDFLATQAVKKLLGCIEKIQDLLAQQESALAKSKEYQKAVNKYELLSFSPGNHPPHDQKSDNSAKKELLKLQHELFLTSLEITL